MIPWMLMHLLGERSTAFPEAPIAAQVSAGRAVYRTRAGIDRTLLADRVTLGTWFDGRVRRAVDTVTWVRAELVGRWIGYLAERDGWTDDVIRRRWAIARHHLEGTETFVVRLAAFPRLDPFEFDIGAPPKPDTLRGVRFRLEFNPGVNGSPPVVLSTLGTCAAMIEKEAPSGVNDRQFYSLTPLAPLFLDDGELDRADDGIRLGDYYGAVYVVSFPTMPNMVRAPQFDLTIQLATKREEAHFRVAGAPEVHTKKGIDEE